MKILSLRTLNTLKFNEFRFLQFCLALYYVQFVKFILQRDQIEDPQRKGDRFRGRFSLSFKDSLSMNFVHLVATYVI